MSIFRRSPFEEAARSQAEYEAHKRAEERPKRILVVGSDGHGQGVKAYRWDKLPQGINVADYDTVILNFAAFEDEKLANSFPIDRLPQVALMTRLIFSAGASIVAIGDPRTLIGPAPVETECGRTRDERVRADYFLPSFIGIEDDRGEQYDVLDEVWRPYFAYLSGWTWIHNRRAHQRIEAQYYLAPLPIDANEIAMLMRPIAKTRADGTIAFEVLLQAVRATAVSDPWSSVSLTLESEMQREVVRKASPVTWLPKPDKILVEEAIDLILREGYGIGEVARLPDWIDGLELPAEAPIADEIATIEDEQRKLAERLADAKRRATEAAEPRKLLYEKGKDVLEPIARDVLRKLGARVEEPEHDGVEDGRLFVTVGRAVLEIKGRDGPIPLKDVRQVVQWASDAKGQDGQTYKPLIVGNPNCDKPLEERGDPFAPNAKTYAENNEVALVTTAQLYEALRQKQLGRFNEEEFWKTVFEGKGALELPEPHRSERPGEEAR